MSSSQEILKKYWGFDHFRPLQEEIINSVMDGRDTLAILPTGGGKSVCYQVPALQMEGLCLVISPLIALMKDQVEGLRRKNITAFSIHSAMTRKEVINTLQVACQSNCKFLYVSPERLETAVFKEYLPGLGVNLIAVDEAHCISQWGYDFRPPYLRIAALRQELEGIPILALTASATPAVQIDICDKLGFKNPGIFRQSFERAKLSYSVFRVDSKFHKLTEILKKVNGSGIVYCKSRRRTKEISDLLNLQNISADYYHAGLNSDERNSKQEAWIRDETRIIVCTNAFGMGIDKPGVRVVVHVDVPDCLENYYQEAGRAGRDNKTAYAVLLYDNKDLADLEQLATARYPPIEETRQVYQALSNYLQIPSGEGAGQTYDFDITDFLKKFKMQAQPVLNSLKTLEQEGWLAFNAQVFLQPTIQFTTNKDYLYSFENENPSLEPIIKTLLRSYEGIFDQESFISEKMVAGLMKTDLQRVINDLQLLHQAGIIRYTPQKDSPRMVLLRARIKAEDLSFNQAAYEDRKKQFLARVGQMKLYVEEQAACRSRMIGIYFGDQLIRACGICDNCLRQKSTVLTKEEFDSLHHRILNMVKFESLHTRELLDKLAGIKKEKAWKVIEFLQSENKIMLDKSGRLVLNSH